MPATVVFRQAHDDCCGVGPSEPLEIPDFVDVVRPGRQPREASGATAESQGVMRDLLGECLHEAICLPNISLVAGAGQHALEFRVSMWYNGRATVR